MIQSRPRLVSALVLQLLCALALSGQAEAAKPSLKKAIWGPVEVAGKSQFPLYKDLGTGIFQLQILWWQVAPTRPANPRDPADPAYVWPAALDKAVAESKRYGIEMLVMVMSTPPWANPSGDVRERPTDAQSYADFIEAIERRYPGIDRYMVWGEPIRTANYLLRAGGGPNYYAYRKGSPRPRLKPFIKISREDAQGYAELVDATYARLKSLGRDNLTIGGNTCTSGDVDPFNWARYMRLQDGKPPRMDMFGHNPWSSRRPNLANRQVLPGTVDFSDLDDFVRQIDRYQARNGRNRKLKLFISEFGAPTDVDSFEFPYYVTRKVQADWATAALKIARNPKNRIATMGWLGLYDQPVRADGGESRTGLIDARGRKKAAYYAFKRG